jgi:AcrR family transcriptional regulator
VSALPFIDPADHPGRRRMTENQAAILGRLVEAAAAEARQHGYEGMTVRGAARRAGVAPATAYTLVASKDHLLAEVMWRRWEDLPDANPPSGASQADQVLAELRVLGTFMADDPLLAAAGTTALLGPGADVRDLRIRLGSAFHARLAAALGDDPDPGLVRSLDLVYTGALLWMGMGHLPRDQVPQVLDEAARLLLGEPR